MDYSKEATAIRDSSPLGLFNAFPLKSIESGADAHGNEGKAVKRLEVKRRLHRLQAFLDTVLPAPSAKTTVRKLPPEFSLN